MIGRTNCTNCEHFWEILPEQIEDNQKQSQIDTSKHENHFDNIY